MHSRDSLGECDTDTYCDGTTKICPPTIFKADGTTCGGSPTGPCEGQRTCNGIDATCPSNFFSPGVLWYEFIYDEILHCSTKNIIELAAEIYR